MLAFILPANFMLTKVFKIELRYKYHLLNSIFLLVLTLVVTYLIFEFEHLYTSIMNRDYLYFSEGYLISLSVFLVVSPVIFAVQNKYIVTRLHKRIMLALISSIFLFIANDFVSTYLFVLPSHSYNFV